MKVLFIWYPKCSTCKDARKFLVDNNIEFIDRDITKDVPVKDEIKAWSKLGNKDIKRFFNTSGIKYKELDLKNRLPVLSDDEKLDILTSDGMLIKRPILVTENNVLIGFNKEIWMESLRG